MRACFGFLIIASFLILNLGMTSQKFPIYVYKDSNNHGSLFFDGTEFTLNISYPANESPVHGDFKRAYLARREKFSLTVDVHNKLDGPLTLSLGSFVIRSIEGDSYLPKNFSFKQYERLDPYLMKDTPIKKVSAGKTFEIKPGWFGHIEIDYKIPYEKGMRVAIDVDVSLRGDGRDASFKKTIELEKADSRSGRIIFSRNSGGVISFSEKE